MRSSAVLALAVLVSAAPSAFAAPAAAPHKARASTSTPPPASSSTGPAAPPVDESGAISLSSLGHLASIGISGLGILGTLFGGSANNNHQRRELLEFLARAEVDESGALSLKSAAGIAGIGSAVVDVIHNLFSGSNNSQRRELIDILSRAETDESAALSLGTIGTIAGFAAPLINGIVNHFKNNGTPQQRRDALTLEHLMARADPDDSGALSLGSAAGIAGIGSAVIDVLHNLFGGSSFSQRRELLEALKRADADESGALSLGTAGTIAGFLAPVINGAINHFRGGDSQRREIAELFARADVDESGALSLKSAAGIAGIGSAVVDVIHNLFSGNSNQRRELMDVLARADVDESGAISVGTIGTIAGFAAPLINGIVDHFKNNGSAQQRRDALELEDIMARATDDSGAISLSSVAGIAGIGSALADVLHNILGGNGSSRRRELMEALARADTDESGALSLGTAGTIAGFLAPVINGIVNHFRGSDSGAQRRDVMSVEDILARAATDLATDDESGAISFSTLKNAGSLLFSGLGIASGLGGLFGGADSQSQRRELMELLARADEDESGAISFSTLKNLGSLIFSGLGIASGVGGLVGGGDSQNQRRELMELLAREDESGALSLESAASIGSIASSVIGALSTLFGQ